MNMNDKIGRALDRCGPEDRAEVERVFADLQADPRLAPLLERAHSRLSRRRARRAFLMSSVVAVLGIGALSGRLAGTAASPVAGGPSPTFAPITIAQLGDDLSIGQGHVDRAAMVLQQVDLANATDNMAASALIYVDSVLRKHGGQDPEVVLPGVTSWLMTILQRSPIIENVTNAAMNLAETVFAASTMQHDLEVFRELLERRG